MINFSCTMDVASTNLLLNGITTIKSSDKLFVGLFLYSVGIRSCTKITAIVDTANITMSQLPISTGTFNVSFSDLTPFKYLDLCEALADVQTIVNENGQYIQYNFRNESNIGRDDVDGISNRRRGVGLLNIKAHPVLYSPTVDQIEQAGFVESQDIIVWLSSKDFFDNDIVFEDIDEIRDTVIVKNETYKIRHKNRVSQIGSSYLYYTLGLRKI